MKIDFDKITVVEMQGISEFFDIYLDGDRRCVVIDGVKQ